MVRSCDTEEILLADHSNVLLCVVYRLMTSYIKDTAWVVNLYQHFHIWLYQLAMITTPSKGHFTPA